MRDFDFIVSFPECVIYTNPVRCSKRRTSLALCTDFYFSIPILRHFKSLFCTSHKISTDLSVFIGDMLKASDTVQLVWKPYETCSWLKTDKLVTLSDIKM